MPSRSPGLAFRSAIAAIRYVNDAERVRERENPAPYSVCHRKET